ncbi:hypothetical protein [Pseudobacteroides cellulosolvens]|uniref:Uncharacterized protein n=1 Tax=Pseudobacteroides cellulosolvens ATCC 35603 = DSM 2933 TaxID=398512 RepID=A0A0L6JL27_9FIRM|nr:hypothetical protein [Pseudobacteroides cellulosolvens]KNY26092.1 hypothetical protein Bccel_1354 [Pseudobacteroides cellulosolvens ATCC 35603 = DSM 2933]
MQYQQYYCIYGNDKLLNNNSIDKELRDILAEPVMLVNPQGGMTDWKHEDYEISVKIMFLMFLNTEYDDSFIKDSPISIEFFDQWWKLKVCSDQIYRDEIFEKADNIIINKIQLTGKELPDSFINDLKLRIKNKE